MKKYVDGILIDMTAEEITAREAEVAQALIDKQAEQNKATAAETQKQNKTIPELANTQKNTK